jgi:hypothetical protein
LEGKVAFCQRGFAVRTIFAVCAVAVLGLSLSGCAVYEVGSTVAGVGATVVGTTATVAGDIVTAPFPDSDSDKKKDK